mgnify:CR=1 FL=1
MSGARESVALLTLPDLATEQRIETASPSAPASPAAAAARRRRRRGCSSPMGRHAEERERRLAVGPSVSKRTVRRPRPAQALLQGDRRDFNVIQPDGPLRPVSGVVRWVGNDSGALRE